MQIIIGLSSSLYITLVAAFIMFMTLPISNTHSQVIWQTQTPPELQGRVFSVRRLISQCTGPVSVAVAGWAGGLFNPGIVVVFLGVLFAVFSIGQMFNPILLRSEENLSASNKPVTAKV
jgi:MFS transporter, DHA3 family, macrolide efflux protein